MTLLFTLLEILFKNTIMYKITIDFEITKLTNSQSEATFDLVCNAFASGSELHKALNISTQEYREFLRPSFNSMLDEDLSLIAFDQQNEQILGCLIACDFCGHDSPDIQIPERFKPISALLRLLEKQYQEIRQFEPGQCMLIDLVVVSPAARELGVYKKLREAAHDMAKVAGFNAVIGEQSSAITQHFCVNRLGHAVMAEIEYASFEFAGAYPFAELEKPPSIQLVEFQIT